jgi:tetratricopeptide (TPR) repeat protein
MTELVKLAGELADADKLDEAMEVCNRVLLTEPDNPGVLYVIGCCLLKAARQVQAIQIAKRITHLCPNDFRGWSLLALCWGELHRYDESVRNAEKAVKCRRIDKTLSDLAYAHTNAGNWDLADKFCREAMVEATVRPSQLVNEAKTNCRVSEGYIRLAKGDWKEGFEAYRATMRTKWRKEWTYGDSQEWQGEPGAVVMVTGEQGLGDEIMAASVIPQAAQACKTFIFDCDAKLASLFKRSFPNIIVTPTRREREITLPVMPTHHKSLFGLGELFRQKSEDFPRDPYLIPDPENVRMFRERFRGKKVTGLAWSGGLPRTGQEPRAAGLNAFLPLLKRGGEFLSLQYTDDTAEVAELQEKHGIRVTRLPWVTRSPDMDLLASLISACDDVVGVHTTALHLASALGVPTTTLVHRGSGWRYAQPELLWYPESTKLWRKKPGESWRDCVERLVR